MLRYGIISDIQESTGRARVNWNDDDIVSDWLPILVPKGLQDSFSWFPDINEHVACLVDEHSDAGVILGAIYSEANKPNGPDKDKWRVRFQDGTVLEYDRKGGKLLADVKGDVEVTATRDVTVDAGGKVEVTAATTAKLTATQVTIESPSVTVTGVLAVGQLAAAPGSSAGNGNVAIQGNIIVTDGNITVTGGNVTADGIGLKTHKHIGVTPGGGTSGIPTP